MRGSGRGVAGGAGEPVAVVAVGGKRVRDCGQQAGADRPRLPRRRAQLGGGVANRRSVRDHVADALGGGARRQRAVECATDRGRERPAAAREARQQPRHARREAALGRFVRTRAHGDAAARGSSVSLPVAKFVTRTLPLLTRTVVPVHVSMVSHLGAAHGRRPVASRRLEVARGVPPPASASSCASSSAWRSRAAEAEQLRRRA